MKKTNKSLKEDFKKERNALLKEMQLYPLDIKVSITKSRIREFVREQDVYFSFSGGKDSEVLAYIGAQALKELGYSKMHVVYIDTGLEYISVRKFANAFCSYIEKKIGIRVILHTLTPKRNFMSVLLEKGYPIISKEVSQCIREAREGIANNDGTYAYRLDRLNGTYRDKKGNLSAYNMPQYKFLLNAPFKISDECCGYTKKAPAKKFEKETGLAPVIATMTCESRLRKTKWLSHGCNIFDGDRPQSCPLSFWLTNDVLEFIYRNKLPIAPAYGEIVAASEKNGQMDLLSFIGCYEGCRYCTTKCDRTGCIFCLFGIMQDIGRITRLQSLEPQRADYVLRGGEMGENGYWRPTKAGLGYWFILEYLKEYGGINIPYEGNYGELDQYL